METNRAFNVRHLLLDMDGVIYRGDQPMPDLHVLKDFLEQRRFSFLLVTNNASMDSLQFSRKLANMGWPVPQDQIVTSAEAAAWYLAQHREVGTRVYVIGMKPLVDAILKRPEAHFVWDEASPDWVVVGIDFSLTYEKLKLATLAIRRGARFVATNGDAVFPSSEGLIPGNGAIVAALRVATGVEPIVLGKPHATLFQAALAKLKASPKDVLMVGDNLETDIAGAKQLGMHAALVLTGVSTETDLRGAQVKPDLVFRSLSELVTWLESHLGEKRQ